ncbi:PE-PPE domain-containing protein [Burkholderia sp. Ch1-1]|nr:PE-PPE domain-containing protein [Burkholderia sp. Ch1-1]
MFVRQRSQERSVWVGSSALGSAAFAWNVSRALGRPVAAIVPGYGVADVIYQALGGWFGFGMYSYEMKQPIQEWLAHTAPAVASIGRGLLKTVPGHAEASTGVPVFRHGSGSSDVLHAILKESDSFKRVFGHSKGALVISNAMLDLPAEKTRNIEVVTFGCPVDESTPSAGYEQFLGVWDWLGSLNAWGNKAEHHPWTSHSTNTGWPLSMEIAQLSHDLQKMSKPQREDPVSQAFPG